MATEPHCLRKAVTTPRRCSYCTKMVFFSGLQCKHCRYRCHRKCAISTGSKSPDDSTQGSLAPLSSGNEEALLSFFQNSSEKYSPSTLHTRRRSECLHLKPKPDSSTPVTRLYSRFVQWVSDKKGRKDPSRNFPSDFHQRSCSLKETSTHCHIVETHNAKNCLGPLQPLDNLLPNNESSNTSLALNVESSISIECTKLSPPQSSPPSSHHKTPSPTNSFQQYHLQTLKLPKNPFICKNFEGQTSFHPSGISTYHNQLVVTLSCPSKTRISSSKDSFRTVLCATWPPSGRKTYEDDDTFNESVFGDFRSEGGEEVDRVYQSSVKETLGEWSIPFSDLEFKECVREGRRRDTYRGRWHGEVMIHTYKDYSADDVKRFWQDVSLLSMIRHENVALFMGACIEPPYLAIVTSMRKGLALYEHVHVKRDKFPVHTKVNIARQIAQGMGYLHAKGIILCKLNSLNIYLEAKVKLCVMNYGMAQKRYDRSDYGCIPKGHLTYISPEILRTIEVKPPRLIPQKPYTMESDIYAFGTVLYELVAGQWPLQEYNPECVIWQIGSGRRQSLEDLKCSSNLKNLIEGCWAHEPSQRPKFLDVVKELQQNAALHKKHSSSEPERLNRLGLGRPICA